MAGTFGFQPLPDIPAGTRWEDNAVQMWINLVSRTVRQIICKDLTFTPAAVNANSTSDQTFTVTGLKAPVEINGVDSSMHVYVMPPPGFPAGLGIAYATIPTDNTLNIRFFNVTGGSLTPTSGLYHITAIRH